MRIDSTQINTFIQCPRLYKNKFIDNLRKVDGEQQTLDLRFGGKVHSCNELYYKDRSKFQLSTIDTIWSDYANLPTDVEKIKTKENGIKLCKDYIEHYRQLDSNWEVLAVEQPLDFEIAKGVWYIVKVDLVVKVNGNIFSVEHKTTKNIKNSYFLKYSPNLQVSAQTYAIKQHFGQCSGVIVNAMALNWLDKPTLLLPDSPEVSNYSQHEVKYCKHYKKEMAYVSGLTTEFRREIVNRTNEQLEDFRIDAINWIRKIKASQLTNIWCKNQEHCRRWQNDTNGKCCEFVDLCLSCDDQSIREELYEVYNSKEYLNGADGTGDKRAD